MLVLLVACRDTSVPAPQPKRVASGDPALDDSLRSLADRPIGRLDHTPGVALDVKALGTRPQTFGDIQVVRPGATRHDVRTRLPAARPDGATLVVATGIADVTAVLTFDRADELDIVTYYMPASARALLRTAWGPPDDHDTWFDREHGIRADAGDDRPSGQLVLSIEAFHPFASLLGHNPDGLADTQPPILGASRSALVQAFGPHLHSAEPLTGVDDSKTLEIMLAATDACKIATSLLVELDKADIADKLVIRQCYTDEPARRAVLAAMEQLWGRAVPGRSPTDRPTFELAIGKRHASAALIHAQDSLDEEWEISIQ